MYFLHYIQALNCAHIAAKTNAVRMKHFKYVYKETAGQCEADETQARTCMFFILGFCVFSTSSTDFEIEEIVSLNWQCNTFGLSYTT